MSYGKNQRARRTLIRRFLDARAVDGADAQALAAHLKERPEDRSTARDLDRLWMEIGRVPAPELRLAPAVDKPPLVDRLLGSLRWSVPMALATGVAMVVLVPLLVRPAPAPPPVQHYAAGADTRTLRLADGSVVTLAPRSALHVAFGDRRRDLRLAQGEAFFQVAHDAARPFAVATAHGETRATGTAFDVQLDGETAIVTVAEGSIRIAGTSADVVRRATAGQQVRYGLDPTGTTTVIGEAAPTQDRNALGWRTGMLTFEGESLAAVVAQMNRYAPRPIILADPALAQLPIFATVRTDSPDGLLAIVAAQAGLGPARIRRALRVEGVG